MNKEESFEDLPSEHEVVMKAPPGLKPNKAQMREIFDDLWSQLDPERRAVIAANRDVLDEILGELLPGNRRPRITRRDEAA